MNTVSTRQILDKGWILSKVASGQISHPDQLSSTQVEWQGTAPVPGTVAQATGISFERPESYQHCKLDASDWWYHCTFDVPTMTTETASSVTLHFEGLATLADIWLNGKLLATSTNIFLPLQCDVSKSLRESDNQLAIHFKSLDHALKAKRPRPRWKTALVSNQNLRFFRTTLLGRMPGWSPPVAPVGPWKPILLEFHQDVKIQKCLLRPSVHNACPQLNIAFTGEQLEGEKIVSANVRILDRDYPLSVLNGPEGELSIDAIIALPEIPLWWPHTHGTPQLIDCVLSLHTKKGRLEIKRSKVGFKSIEFRMNSTTTEFSINGVRIFCRGACWTVNDFISLVGTDEQLEASLILAKDAGLNMFRVGGTMLYESDRFYQLCDELGILVWQDFMFTNMDYPIQDPSFFESISAEAKHQVERLTQHPCIAIFCGNSEVQQQAAMLGLSPQDWSNSFFEITLPAICAQAHSGVPYISSSPVMGALPFQVSQGVAHYYGVGAYKRPLSDVKHAGVRFATECLAFSNHPAAQTLDVLPTRVPHHPLWKERVPRDNGSSWDFEDTRDHYLKTLFAVDPQTLRSHDLERYTTLSSLAVGETMKSVFSEWRKPKHECGGGLVWFFKDLWPGAGWGIVDSMGRAKAPLHFLKRVWASQTVLVTDEGLDGLGIHVLNERDQQLEAVLKIEILQQGKHCVGVATTQVSMPPRSEQSLSADSLLGYFADLTYSYRFGPPKHDGIHVTLTNKNSGDLIAEDFFFPPNASLSSVDLSQLNATLTQSDSDQGEYNLLLKTTTLLRGVRLEADGYLASNNYFDLGPSSERKIVFKRDGKKIGTTIPIRVEISAANLGTSPSDCLTLRST